MAVATMTYPGDREATMEYIRADSKMNRRYMAAGTEVSTGKYETRKVLVHDIRAEKQNYSLARTGFELVGHSSKVSNWSDMKELETTYSKEIEALVKKLTGADKVVVFGPARRTTHKKDPNKTENAWDNQPPASDVHVDYTPFRAESLAKDFAQKNGFDRNDYKRVKLINLWRATSPGPHDWPLALCRGDSIGNEEGVINHLIYVDEIPDFNTLPAELPFDPMYPEGSLFIYKETHYWTYFSQMTPDEVMVFTLYDSDQQVPWRVPHCAFQNNMEGTKARESVEIRTACYFN